MRHMVIDLRVAEVDIKIPQDTIVFFIPTLSESSIVICPFFGKELMELDIPYDFYVDCATDFVRKVLNSNGAYLMDHQKDHESLAKAIEAYIETKRDFEIGNLIIRLMDEKKAQYKEYLRRTDFNAYEWVVQEEEDYQ